MLDRVKAEKLKGKLIRIVNRTVRDSFQRITGSGDKVKGALKSLIRSVEKKKKVSLETWKIYIAKCKHGDLMDEVRSHKLKMHLSEIEKRCMREAFQRIGGGGDRVRGAVKSVIRQIEKRKKVALTLWVAYNQECRHGTLLNAIKSEKLRISLLKVPARVMRDAYQRVIGDGSKIKGAVRTVIKQIEKRSKVSYIKWKEYLVKCKHGVLFDGIRSQKLKIALGNLTRRTLRDSAQRIFGAGDKVKGAIKDIIRKIEKRPQFAFIKWKAFKEECKQ